MIRNLLWVGLHHGVGRAAMFVFFLALPRLLPIATVGEFTLWYTVLLVLCQPPLDFSLSMVIVKHTARGELSTVRAAMGLAFAGLPLLLAILGLVSLAAPVPHRLISWLLLALGLTLSINLVFAGFRGREHMQVEGVVGTAQKVAAPLFLAALAAVGTQGSDLPALSLVGMGVVGWLLLTVLFPRRVGSLVSELRAAPPTAVARRRLLYEGLTLGAVGLVGMLYLRIDVVMLGMLSTQEEVGLYFTASRCLEAAYIVPHVLMLVYLPRLLRQTRLRQAVRRMAWPLLALSFAALAALAAIARWLLPLIYGGGLPRISSLLLVLAPAVLPVYLGFLLTQALVAADRERHYLVLAVVGLALNVLLNIILIPAYAGAGAAAATVATELAIAVGAGWALFRDPGRESGGDPGR